MAPQGTKWCFTCFGDFDPNLIFDSGKLNYLGFGSEICPTSGRPHAQGFLQTKSKLRLNSVKRLFGDLNPHLELMMSSFDDNRTYCSKSGNFTEFGEFIVAGGSRGKRARELLDAGSDGEVEDPHMYRRARMQQLTHQFLSDFTPVTWEREWMKELRRLISEPADYRSIIWVYGIDGGEGKTWTAKSLWKEGWFYSSGGKVQDVMYLYSSQPTRHVVFDIPRDYQDYVNYGLMEKMKDRVIVSTKYEPVQTCVVNPIHVVVMANFLPDLKKISSDRCTVIDCNLY